MARTWLSIRVELLGGNGEDLWPYPGRVLLVGPSHTFADLAKAIDDTFARWDRSHLCQFALADGTVVTDEETGDEVQGTPFGPISSTTPLVLDRTKVADRVGPGEEFRYVFDFGDEWTHACTVETAKVDPVDVLGIVPKTPTASRGWGSIPDQYGRRWDGDDGESMPRRPAMPHPMLIGAWPEPGPGEPVDLKELRGATFRGDVPAILAAIEDRDVDELLQHVGMALQVVLAAEPGRGGALVESVVNRLDERGLAGDDVLAEDLVAQLRGTPLAARHLPVDLSELADALSGDPMEPGGYLDLRSGEVIPWILVDPAYVSEDEEGYVDVEEDPDRWLALDRPDSRAQWRDMAEFAVGQPNADLRRRLETAIEGKGAFRRFRDAVHEEDLVEQWHRYSDEREIGRARAYLADQGIRVSPPAPS